MSGYQPAARLLALVAVCQVFTGQLRRVDSCLLTHILDFCFAVQWQLVIRVGACTAGLAQTTSPASPNSPSITDEVAGLLSNPVTSSAAGPAALPPSLSAASSEALAPAAAISTVSSQANPFARLKTLGH